MARFINTSVARANRQPGDIALDFVGPSYSLARKKADTQRLINMATTPIESGAGVVPVFLQSIAGLSKFSEPITPLPPPPRPTLGLLNHFEHYATGGDVVSAIGPPLRPVSTAAISTVQHKFDSSSGRPDPSYGNYGFTSEPGILGTINASWRVEGWFYPLADCGYFKVSTNVFSVNLTRFTLFGDSAFLAEITSNLGTGGGRWGNPSNAAKVGQWNHVGLQFDAVVQDLTTFCNGVNIGRIGGTSYGVGGLGPGNFFNGVVWTSVVVAQGDCYVDDIYYHFINQSEIYGATYTVPTASFYPPDL